MGHTERVLGLCLSPETRVEVSGERQRPKTLSVWPISSATRVMAGYLQMTTSLEGYPWLDTNSLYSGAHTKEQTCDLVSVLLICVPLLAFQILMHLSAVPPPVARVDDCQGHQATAFTAAQ